MKTARRLRRSRKRESQGPAHGDRGEAGPVETLPFIQHKIDDTQADIQRLEDENIRVI